MADAFEEADLHTALKDNGQVLGAFVIARGEREFVIYMRASWTRGRGFRIIRTWRGSTGDRTFKSLQSAWGFIRRFKFFGRVTIYPIGDIELQRFMGVMAQDLQASAAFPASTVNDPGQAAEACPKSKQDPSSN